jgi:hypothetical protein
MHRLVRGLAALGAAALVVLPASTAFAHGEVTEGDVAIEVGFGTEPAYAGFPNSVQVLLTHGDHPVTDATGMTVDVIFGDQTTTMDLVPNFEVGGDGEPGDYRAFFVPSQTGPYTFHVKGTVDGEKVDVKMSSGPGTFAEVEPIANATFPQVQAPGLDELAGRIETESEKVTAATNAAAVASDDASTARTTAMLALIVGAIGVIAGIAGIVTARRGRAV